MLCRLTRIARTSASVPADASYAEAVYRLYDAGVLTGNDAYGTFTPFSYITRGAAAAIVGRMADASLRKAVTLEKAPFRPTPIGQLQNRASLKRSCTDAELQAAYDAALEVVTPLADLSREEQLYGIAVTLRYMVDSGKVTYTTSQAHYNDPYGYFVLGISSCACTFFPSEASLYFQWAAIPNSAALCISTVRIWISKGWPEDPITVVCRD